MRQFSDLDAAGDDFASYKNNIVAIEKSPKKLITIPMPELLAVDDKSSSFKLRTYLMLPGN